MIFILCYVTYSIILQLYIHMEKNNWQKVVVNSRIQPPQSRWGHAAVNIADSIIIFAGYANAQYMNDIWEFNTITMQWIEHKTTGEIPMSRSNCTMHYDIQHNNIIVFGGGSLNKRRFNDVHVLNWQTKQWKELKPQQSDKVPWQRTYHSSDLIYPYLIVFGGESLTDHNDLWTFNLETNEWYQIVLETSQAKPTPRRFHTSVVINKRFYVIAGCYDKYRCINDVYEIDFSNYQKTGSTIDMQWKQLKLKNNSFLARWGHSSVVYNDKIYIFGGRFSNDLQDIIVIDPELQYSKSLKVVGQLPKARRRHSCVFVGSCMIIFGGFNGQYFNDLHFINVMNIKPKAEITEYNNEQHLIKWINEQIMSDIKLLTNDNNEFYVHYGLIHDKCKKEQVEMFLKQINQKYSECKLRQIFEILYTGIGDLNNFTQSKKYQFNNLYETSLEKQNSFKKQILTFNSQQCSFSSLQNSPLIILQQESYNRLMSISRQDKYHDLTIIFNGQFYIPVNKILLAANSQYFYYLLKSYHEKQLQITLDNELNDVRVFQVLINFLQTGYVIIPKQLDWNCWIYIYQLADYFCLKRLTRICQFQLIKEITAQNYKQIFTVALQYDLKMLISHCSLFNFDLLVQNKQIEYLKSLKNGASTKIQQILYQIYLQQRFSLKQLQLKSSIKIIDISQKNGPETVQVKQNTFKILQ